MDDNKEAVNLSPPSLEHQSLIEIERRKLSEKLYNDMRDGVHPLNNEKLYSHLIGLSADKKKQLLERYTILGTHTPVELPDNVIMCFFHPGVAVRTDNFLRFVYGDSTNRDLPPVKLISKFSDTLGAVRLYRGMALTREELDYIEKNQMLSPGMRNQDLGERIFYDMLKPEAAISDKTDWPNSFVQDCFARITDSLPITGSITLSTSVYNEVASSVGWHSAGRELNEGVSPYLFALNVPRIMTYQEEGIMGDFRGPDSVVIDGKRFPRDGLEVFVPFVISNEWINDITKVDVPKAWR